MNDVIYTTPTQTLDFFNFQLDVLAGQVVGCRMDGQPIDTAIWSGIFLIKQKYDDKNEKFKRRKMMFDKKQSKYCQDVIARSEEREHYREHIKRAETKLCEYKNTILAFGKLASTSAISK